MLRTLDSFAFSMVPSVNKAKILELARGDYLAQCENILLVGEIGTGKTHLATALGVAACRQGKRARFYTAANLVHELTEARDDRRLLRLQKQLMKQDLMILDEVGFVPLSTQGSQLLFQFCSERYQRGSMILTTLYNTSRQRYCGKQMLYAIPPSRSARSRREKKYARQNDMSCANERSIQYGKKFKAHSPNSKPCT